MSHIMIFLVINLYILNKKKIIIINDQDAGKNKMIVPQMLYSGFSRLIEPISNALANSKLTIFSYLLMTFLITAFNEMTHFNLVVSRSLMMHQLHCRH